MQTIKAITVDFTFGDKSYKFSCPFNQLDRNYEDESYAYFLHRIPETRYGLFEMNILKDYEGGHLQEHGYVSVYSNMDNVKPDKLIDAHIKFM